MKNSNLYYCLVGMAILWSSCWNIEDKSGQKKEESSPNSTLVYRLKMIGDTAEYEQQQQYLLEDSLGNVEQPEITKIIFSYPIFTKLPQHSAQDTINKMINGILLDNVGVEQSFGSLQEKMQEFIHDYEVHKKEMQEFGLPFSTGWLYHMRINVLLNTPEIITMRVHETEFTGGAHANYWTNYININAQTGNIIELETLLLDKNKASFIEIAEQQFRMAVNVSADTSLADTPYEFEDGESFVLPNNFSIGEKGLAFHYNPYDLGPFAMGEITFEVPYEALHTMLNPAILSLIPTVITK